MFGGPGNDLTKILEDAVIKTQEMAKMLKNDETRTSSRSISSIIILDKYRH